MQQLCSNLCFKKQKKDSPAIYSAGQVFIQTHSVEHLSDDVALALTTQQTVGGLSQVAQVFRMKTGLKPGSWF